MKRTPIQVLRIEDSDLDVVLGVRTLEQSEAGASWRFIDVEKGLRVPVPSTPATPPERKR